MKSEEILNKYSPVPVKGTVLWAAVLAAMEEYASKGMRWVKASERLPKNNRKNIFRYLGNHYRKGDTFQSTEIGKGLIQFIEWLEESPNKSSVASSQHKPHVESVEAGKADKENEPVELQERAKEYAERVCNGSFPIEYTREQVVKHTANDFIAGFNFRQPEIESLQNQSKVLSAIKNGLEKSLSESLSRIKELEADNEILKMENSHSKLVVDEAKREIDRLRGLVEEAHLNGFKISGEGWNGEYPFSDCDVEIKTDETYSDYWQKFKENNNISPSSYRLTNWVKK